MIARNCTTKCSGGRAERRWLIVEIVFKITTKKSSA